MESARKLATFEDLAALEDDRDAEIIDGEIVFSPRPLPPSNRTQGGLYHYLGGPFDFEPNGPGGWWILIEPEVELARHQVFIPDLAGWRRSRMPAVPESRPIRLAPDWVCELLSPSTARRDRIRKADVYLKSGVPHYWLVDVPERLLEAWEARDGAWVRLGAWSDGDRPRVPPFDAIELDVGRLFPPVPV